MNHAKTPKLRTRPTVVELHPKRLQIEKDLCEGLQIASLSKKYGISRQALLGYKRNRLPERVVKAVERSNITDAQQLFEVILKAVRRMEKLSDACDDFLQDPDRPGEYYMGPRAHEIMVAYNVREPRADGKGYTVRRIKEPLQNLIDRVEDRIGGTITRITSTETDPRLLLVKSSDALTKSMETLVNAWKSIDQGRSNFVGTDSWRQVVEVILKATERYPEVRREIANGLDKITGE